MTADTARETEDVVDNLILATNILRCGDEHIGAGMVDAALSAARAQERERCALAVESAYAEWGRLQNEHEQRWVTWKTSGEVGEMPVISIGSLPEFIAAALRGLSHGGDDAG